MDKLTGIIEHIIFHNGENGWTVMSLTAEGCKGPVTVVGNFIDLPPGTMLGMSGEWRNDPRFGLQFAAGSWEIVMPSTLLGIERYLGSGLIKGIGKAYAKAIVRRFGADTFDIIENQSQRLREIDGLGPKRIEKIVDSWASQKEIRQVMVFLQGNGVSPAYAAKIYRRYGAEAVTKVRENPYRLADEIRGIGFKTADAIALNMGYAVDSPNRCRSGVLYALRLLSDDGHVFATSQQLTEASSAMLDLGVDFVSETIAGMVRTADIITDGDALYLPSLHRAETSSARLLGVLMKAPPAVVCKNECTTTSKDCEIRYDDIQLEAIRKSAASKVMVLTGGPGTGKTTVTKGIITAFEAAGMKILLAAPTGRAAKRMSEATGMKAATIHRLLGYSPAEGWAHNADDPLSGDALIVDECSMIDIGLFSALLDAIPKGMRLIMVGDVDQLPSVGPGNVLRDVIGSGVIPVVRLTRIFRQAQCSRIVMNAHAINEGRFPDISNGRDTDFFFIRTPDASSIPDTVVSLVAERLPRSYGVPAREIQVLTPMRVGDIGSVSLNKRLREAVNPRKAAISRGDCAYSVGDKVMQIRNNYDKKTFNGDIGYISEINIDDNSLTVDFDGKYVEYESSEIDELSLAYAVTIHKSQGSEFPIVVIPVTMNHYVMLQRNLIYTGVTRARRICVLVGDERALAYAVGNKSDRKRNSRLASRLAAAT